MSVLYHMTMPPPAIPETDAMFQEVETLRAHLGGEMIYINPSNRPGTRLPRIIHGLQRLPYLRKREEEDVIHHVYNPDLYPFPYMRWLRRPVVYSVIAGLRGRKPLFGGKALGSIQAIVVSNERDLCLLNSWGFENCRFIRPGTDLSRFGHSPLPLRSEFVLLAGSAPWTHGQFRQKGVDVLLGAAKARPDLRPVFLWRGLLAEEMQRRIGKSGLANRVEFLNRRVDVNQVLAQAHAAVVLSDTPEIIKAYPHSLLESLAAGKPVLLSRCIPMADYVEGAGCGVVVEQMTVDGLLRALERLIEGYDEFQANALRVGGKDFSPQTLAASFGQLYDELLARASSCQ